MSPLDAGWIETRAPDSTGKLRYASKCDARQDSGNWEHDLRKRASEERAKKERGREREVAGMEKQGGKEERQGNASEKGTRMAERGAP